jgi:hypothetical protein
MHALTGIDAVGTRRVFIVLYLDCIEIRPHGCVTSYRSAVPDLMLHRSVSQPLDGVTPITKRGLRLKI